ncbi:hypothetical protein C0991_001690 [Blastosporella zonata]|nr:hypothetical protein C0991_001690 [Blastosporella zonata]
MSMSQGTSGYNARTYGRKSLGKRKQSMEMSAEPRKRRRASVEADEATDVEDTTPSTPKQPAATLARDLSDIFQSCSPKASLASTPVKLARRMLARTKTDSSIESTSVTQIDRTTSLPILPSSSPPKPPTPPPHFRLPPVSVTTNTRTYAGKSRSFLVAIPASSLDPLALDQDEDEYSTRESYASLRSRWGVDNSEDDPYPVNSSPARSDATSTPGGTPTKVKRKAKELQEALLRAKIPLPNGMMNPLKSITELRSKGESRRFLDEVGYLFEGMESTVGIGLRRARCVFSSNILAPKFTTEPYSALEIITKLCDPEFARKAKAADFLSRAWEVLGEAGAGKGEDKLLDTLLAFFAALVAQDSGSIRDLVHHPPSTPPVPDTESSKTNSSQHPSGPSSVVDTLFSFLSASSDPLALVSASSEEKARNEAELRKLGVGKKDRTMFQTIHDTIVSKSSLFPPNAQISTPLLVLYALQALPPAIIPPRHLLALIASLRHIISPVLSPAPTTAYLAWPDAKIPFEAVHCALRLLDVYLLGQWGTAVVDADTDEGEQRRVRNANEAELEKARDEWLADGLIALGVCAELAGGVSARNCMQVTFRVLVSLTHSDEVWGRKIIESECALGFVSRVILGFRSPVDSIGVVKKEEEMSGAVPSNRKGKTKVEEGADDKERTTHALDTLCLALGLLTNLVQVVDRTKDLLCDFRIDPTCTLKKRACIHGCTCPHPISALDILITLYKRQAPPSPSPFKSESEPVEAATADHDHDSDALFLRGHLAVLFGLLIRGSPANEAYVLGKLGGPERLVEHARDFAAFYDAFGGEAEGRVARDVVAFLERLGS